MSPHEYNILRRVWRWLRQIRHRCGYGVHSPLAFQFITDVVYNSAAYYAYATLRQPLEPSITRCDEYDPASGLAAKDLRLLFRLANYQQPTTFVLQGASAIIESYLRAARRAARIEPLRPEAPLHSEATVMVYLDSCRPSDCEAALQQLAAATEGMIVVRGIHNDASARQCWHALQQHPAVTLTFDLGRLGVILRRDKINRQHYIVNYF